VLLKQTNKPLLSSVSEHVIRWTRDVFRRCFPNGPTCFYV